MIDWKRVAELRDEIGTDDFDEVVELFLDEVHGVIENLRHNPNPDDLESDLHFLKGSALNLGFSDFSEKCHSAERHVANEQRDLVEMQALLICFDQSLTEFLDELPRKFAA
ncbi:TMAO reductase sytem sensor TorS [Thalassovita gelatinovora]|uniref:TMAO reductase sytem sensor TorS n=1 Tax=Thalassovita gelatinovora TaxID=53501 RepID=A0A0P1FA14_THAGE|nr:Hpt domain-containing protein [Thalassovita gelatinovora]QIZ81072.1 Hpt domain-containing protein [Thalassovita gelatinovora]CUH64950.1 TMAO reductase sytem sensor TorS [Thalassovita gelatinovora]SEP88981.1 Hpt domain-containing protein [Thalassovita gelatinovora]